MKTTTKAGPIGRFIYTFKIVGGNCPNITKGARFTNRANNRAEARALVDSAWTCLFGAGAKSVFIKRI